MPLESEQPMTLATETSGSGTEDNIVSDTGIVPTSRDPATEAARRFQYLSTGEMARLRRMDATGAPAFWRLSSEYEKQVRPHEDIWLSVIRMIALLTPKGPPKRASIHSKASPLGAVLQETGYSEARLVRLLATRGENKLKALERTIRFLASKLKPGETVDVTDIARMAISSVRPDDLISNKVARTYFDREYKRKRDSSDPSSKD